MVRVLIVNNNMHMGGVQKALLNLLRQIHASYDITLLLLYKGGELLDQVPADVRVIEASSPLRYWGMTRYDTTTAGQRLGRSFWAALTRAFGRGLSCSLAALPQRSVGGFDVAISFLHSGNPKAFYGGCNEFVLRCVRAPQKVTFLHNDFRQIHAVSAYNRRMFCRFELIAACSEGCERAFLEVMPELADKTIVVPNCHDYQTVRRKAQEEPVSLDAGRLNIVTVARLGREKGVTRAIRALGALDSDAMRLRYNVIGDGIELPEAQGLVEELGLQDVVLFLGEMLNPYGYMEAADVLLIPSYAEAAPLVIGEAACLGTPVLSTRTSSSKEMIEDAGLGWVCENSDRGLQDGLRSVLAHEDEVARMANGLRDLVFNDDLAVRRFDELVEACVSA